MSFSFCVAYATASTFPRDTFLKPSVCLISSSGKRYNVYYCKLTAKLTENTTEWWNSQFGMLIPAGMPLPAKVSTSSEVKSGLRKRSFSNAAGQGSSGSKTSAELTSCANRALIALFTTATKPGVRGQKCEDVTSYLQR